MKKHTYIITILLLTISAIVNAQEQKDEQPKPAKDNILQGGFSFGYYGYGFVGNRTGLSIPLTASYEKYIDEHFSVGGFVGYAGYRYKDANDRKYGWSFLDFGPRASFHYLSILNDILDRNIDTDKFDFYLSAMLIFESRSFSSDNTYYDDYYENEFDLTLGTTAGFRYRISDSLFLYFEGGRGTFGYGTFGVSYFF